MEIQNISHNRFSPLFPISKKLKSGQVVAIMGPSGAGKSTFLDIITKRLKPFQKSSIKFERTGKLALIEQNDMFWRDITTRECLHFTATMSGNLHPETQINEWISWFNIKHVQNSSVENLSGGQRKRVSIIQGLLRTHPSMQDGESNCTHSILVLDEPTSGLDTHTATETMKILHELAYERNYLILTTLHSPSLAAWQLIDDVVLIGEGGKVLYWGDKLNIEEYFTKWCDLAPRNPERFSEPEWLMDISTGNVESRLVQKLNDGQGSFLISPFQLEILWQWFLLNQDKTNHQLTRLVVSSTQPTDEPPQKRSRLLECRVLYTILTILFQLKEVMKLTILQWYRKPLHLILDQTFHFLSGLLISIAVQPFQYLPATPSSTCIYTPLHLLWQCYLPTDYVRQTVLFVMMGSMFACIMSATRLFVERECMKREWRNGMNSGVYFIGRVLVDLGRLVMGAVMFSMGLVVIGSSVRGIPLYKLVGMLILFYWTAFPMGYAVSMVLRRDAWALAGTAMALLFSLILSGLQPSLVDIKSTSMAWLYEISSARWFMQWFWREEVHGRGFSEDDGSRYGFTQQDPEWLWILLIGFGWLLLGWVLMFVLLKRQ